MASKKRVSQVNKVVRRVVDLGSLPKGTVTLDDVLSTNDINETLAELQAKRGNIESLVVAWVNSDGRISYRYVKCTDYTIITICEIVKQHCIQQNWLTPP